MAAICRGVAPAIRTQSSYPKSCFSKPRAQQSFPTMKNGCGGFLVSPLSLVLPNNRFSTRGKGSAIIPGLEIFMPLRESPSINMVANFQAVLKKCADCRELGNTRPTQSPLSPSINRSEEHTSELQSPYVIS